MIIHHCQYLSASYPIIFVPRLSRKWGTLKLVRPSVCPSVCHKNYNLAHIFWSINDTALIFGMHGHCDKPFSIGTMLWPWPLSYVKVKFVAGRGTTILRICLYLFLVYQLLDVCIVINNNKKHLYIYVIHLKNNSMFCIVLCIITVDTDGFDLSNGITAGI